MRTRRTWSILAAGLLAAACTGAANEPALVKSGADGQQPDTHQPDALEELTQVLPEAAPAAPAPPAAEATEDARGAGSEGESTPAGRAANAAPAKKSARARDFEPERPGLGTTWGETRESHVSNAAFERSSDNPFSLTSIHYNDSSGVVAMLHGASPVAFRTDAATVVSNGAVTVRLVDANGNPLPTFATAKGPLVEGDVGQRYLIELVNQTSSRFEAVVSVDGLDVIDGRTGGFDKRGYLLLPFATLDIDGFRQNMDQVAAFRFGSVRGSYAAQKGSDRNVGVIGVALFAERGSPWSERELRSRETADPFPARFASPPPGR